MINYLWFVLAAFCEIAGCYAFYLWLRLGKSALWVLPGLLSLTLTRPALQARLLRAVPWLDAACGVVFLLVAAAILEHLVRSA
ncbi:hypothetical protein HKT45_11920 [Pseudomonas aeruginosa]|nr:hypothetical protein [Pseudomonas aeruginosa]